MAILSWNAGTFLTRTADKVERGMRRAGNYVERQAKEMVNRPNIHGDDPSLPGEPPKKVSGEMESHIGFEIVREPLLIRCLIGVSQVIPYACRLELGFVGVDSRGRHYNQAPRPFLRPALLRSRSRIIELIARA